MYTFFAQLGALLALGGIGAEYVMRKRGRKPGRKPPWMVEHDLTIEPDGRFFTKDDLLGWRHLAGRYSIQLSEDFSFTVTQQEQGRITRPLELYDTVDDRPKVWVFGCSYTHGWSLDDDETYCWQLQERLPQYEVVNWGGDGYGTLQSLLSLERELQRRDPPEVVILGHADFHDERNTFSRSWKKILTASNKMGAIPVPCARLDREGNLRIRETRLKYVKFPLMEHSAFVHQVEKKYNRFLNRLYRNGAVTQAIIERMAETCDARGIEFAVAGITQTQATRDMLDYCRNSLNLHAIDVSVNAGRDEHNNLPHDPHPNGLANRQYAEELELYLRENMLAATTLHA